MCYKLGCMYVYQLHVHVLACCFPAFVRSDSMLQSSESTHYRVLWRLGYRSPTRPNMSSDSIIDLRFISILNALPGHHDRCSAADARRCASQSASGSDCSKHSQPPPLNLSFFRIRQLGTNFGLSSRSTHFCKWQAARHDSSSCSRRDWFAQLACHLYT